MGDTMVITISGTQVQIIGEPDIIFQNNNLVNTLVVVTDKDESWQYNVDIYMPNSNRYNSIIMTRNGNMLSVDLTRQMLPENGRYIFQFRGQSGNAVYHTDKFCLWVKDSIDLNEAYDPMPAEFYQMESQMKDILKQVQETAAETLPEINENTSGQYLTNDGTEAKWGTIEIESGITQEQADARYLQLSGGIMTGELNVNGNDITGAHNIIAEGSATDGLRLENNGSTARFLCGGATSISFSENAIDAYEHRVVRVGEPINNTDAARKQDVDAVQTAVDTVSETVDGIIDGTEVIPYLSEDGGTLSGTLNMGNNKIAMGGTPTDITDVTNKGYVDGVVKVVSDEVDGILAGTTPVAIPAATETHIGGIKPGAGTAVSGDGTLTIIVPVPTVEDNGKILVAENGTYVLKTLAEIQG